MRLQQAAVGEVQRIRCDPQRRSEERGERNRWDFRIFVEKLERIGVTRMVEASVEAHKGWVDKESNANRSRSFFIISISIVKITILTIRQRFFW